MAATELQYLFEDFRRLSQLRSIEKPTCVLTWSEPEVPVPNEAWDFVARQNYVHSHHMNRYGFSAGDYEGVRECERIRDELLTKGEKEFGRLEVLNQGQSCLWWSDAEEGKFEQHFERLSSAAARIVGECISHPQVVSDDSPATKWLMLARQLIRSDEWYESQDQVIVDAGGESDCEELAVSWEDYPSRSLCAITDDLVFLSVNCHLQQLASYLRFKAAVIVAQHAHGALRLVSEDLGDPVTYSLRALRTYAVKQQREQNTEISSNVSLSAKSGVPDRLSSLRKRLDEIKSWGDNMEMLFRNAARELVRRKGEKFKIGELAKLSGSPPNTHFKSRMRILKTAGVFDADEHHYVLTTLGIELCELAVALESQGQGQG